MAYIPTKVHFGRDVIEDLPEAVQEQGNRVLFLYGKGSVVKAGIYDKVKKKLDSARVEVYEYSGIKSNPVVDDVDKAAELGRSKKVDVIVALGGGSVIDSSKVISLAIANNQSGWTVMKGKADVQAAVPVIAILTLAATGTEMNNVAVVQNHVTREKIGFRHPLMYPKHSFLDPQFTYSVPRNYTAYGVIDLIAHCFEIYFGAGDCSLSDRFIEAIVKDALEWGPKVIEEPDNYEYRANIMWDATNALNGLTGYGKVSGDWGVHNLGHSMSLLYDVPHGASLSIVYPAWLKLLQSRIPERIRKLGNQLFGLNDVDEIIAETEHMFQLFEGPVRLSEVNITEDKIPALIENISKNKVTGLNHKLNNEDYEKLVDLMK